MLITLIYLADLKVQCFTELLGIYKVESVGKVQIKKDQQQKMK